MTSPIRPLAKTKLTSLLEELETILKKPLPLRKRSSGKNDPAKVIKAILRELPKFKVPAATGKKKSRR